MVKEEEEAFDRTLDRGIALFEEAATSAGNEFHARARADDKRDIHNYVLQAQRKLYPGPGYKATRGIDWRSCPGSSRPLVDADDAFKLHDTYGFPLDLTQVMAAERGMTVDVDGFNRLMEEAREKSRQGGPSSDATQSLTEIVQADTPPPTRFIGYDRLEHAAQTGGYLYVRIEDRYLPMGAYRQEPIKVGDRVAAVFDETPFYAKAGGQVGDSGWIEWPGQWKIRVDDTIRNGEIYFHLGELLSYRPDAVLQGPYDLIFQVDSDRRARIMANHTGTHLMNRALRDVLGDHVQQKGSLVDDAKLRFDFSHNAALAPEEIDKIEQQVNTDITADLKVYAAEAAQEDALKINGLRAVFGEKYPPRVRVVSIGAPVEDLLADPDSDEWMNLSIEFCGGTHLAKTGDAEGFVVTAEEAVAKGVRRVTALTGAHAHRATAQGEMLQARLETLGSLPAEELASSLTEFSQSLEGVTLPLITRTQLRDGIAQLQKKVKEQQKQQSKASAGAAVETARSIADQSDGPVIVASLEVADAGDLRTAMDVIRKKRPDSAMLLGAVTGDKVAFVASVPKAMIDDGLKAGDWVREVAKVAGGGGGGRPDMAQAGGKDPRKLEDALHTARGFADSKLQTLSETD